MTTPATLTLNATDFDTRFDTECTVERVGFYHGMMHLLKPHAAKYLVDHPTLDASVVPAYCVYDLKKGGRVPSPYDYQLKHTPEMVLVELLGTVLEAMGYTLAVKPSDVPK
jgi:hypothetical protein